MYKKRKEINQRISREYSLILNIPSQGGAYRSYAPSLLGSTREGPPEKIRRRRSTGEDPTKKIRRIRYDGQDPSEKIRQRRFIEEDGSL